MHRDGSFPVAPATYISIEASTVNQYRSPGYGRRSAGRRIHGSLGRPSAHGTAVALSLYLDCI